MTTTHGTLYIGPTADDVRRILRDAGCDDGYIVDNNGRPAVDGISIGLRGICDDAGIVAQLVSALVSATLERDAWKLVADSHARRKL